MTADELKKRYADAEVQITDIYAGTKATTVISYQTQTKEKTDKVLRKLRKDTTEYCNKEIENIYRDSIDDLYDELDLDEEWHKDRAAEVNTIQEAKEDTESKLLGAIAAASLCLTAYGVAARTSFGDDAEMFKEKMMSQIADDGIQGSAYFRDGAIVNGGLSSYADVVLEGTETMVSNTAVMDTMLANGWDLVKVSSHDGACPICVPYEDRVFSISGSSDEYPYLYDTEWNEAYQNFHPNCRHYITPFFPETQSEEELQEIQAFSNRSFEVGGKGWTEAQTQKAQRNLQLYEKAQQRKSNMRAAAKYYEKFKAVLGKDCPASVKDLYKIKRDNDVRWTLMHRDYLRRQRLLDKPDLALPNADKAYAERAKFTNYFFGGNNEAGLSKGRAFSSRLGYNISNWGEFRAELESRALFNPAKMTGAYSYGDRYSQNMIVYGKKGTPMDIKAIWEVKANGEPRLITAYPD